MSGANPAPLAPPANAQTLADLVEHYAAALDAAGVSFGHGTTNAHDEAAWLVLWGLGLPLDTSLDTRLRDVQTGSATARQAGMEQNHSHALDGIGKLATLFEARIQTRKPAAYLTHEAWLCGVPFYVDERSIVPRSLIAELLMPAEGHSELDGWLSESTHRVLDLCTGNGSLAVLAALAYPDVVVDAIDLSPDALAVARINVDQHGLGERIRLIESDGLAAVAGQRYDLILCNPPYVNSASMAALPAEYRAEPTLALAGGLDGMDFIRRLLRDAPNHLTEHGVLVLEIGNEQPNWFAAFPELPVVWLNTSAGDAQVLLITAAALAAHPHLS